MQCHKLDVTESNTGTGHLDVTNSNTDTQ